MNIVIGYRVALGTEVLYLPLILRDHASTDVVLDQNCWSCSTVASRFFSPCVKDRCGISQLVRPSSAVVWQPNASGAGCFPNILYGDIIDPYLLANAGFSGR